MYKHTQDLSHAHMLQRLFSHHIFRYVILWEAHGEWFGSKTPGCVYNKGDLLKQGWHWEPGGGGIYLESSRALAKLWSALVLRLPFLCLPTTDWPMNTAAHRGWPWCLGNRAEPDSNSRFAGRQDGPLFHHAHYFKMKCLYGQWCMENGKQEAGSSTLDPGLLVFETNQRKSLQWM